LDDIPEITAMRGYASLGVVVYHMLIITNLWMPTLLTSMALTWNTGVDFFFVLSGFLLSAPFIAQAGKQDLRDYYVKRIFRILPVYYLSVVVVGFGFLLVYHDVTLQQIAANLFFVQSFFRSTFDSVNGVNWTLVIEEVFYATLPIFSLFFLRGRWKVALPVCLAVSLVYKYAVISAYGNTGDLTFYLWQYPSYLANFALGATLANFYVYDEARAARRHASSIPLLACIGVLAATQYWTGMAYAGSNYRVLLPGELFPVEYAALIYAAITSPLGSVVNRAFVNPAASYLGRVSYSMYTWHLPVEEVLFTFGLPWLEWGCLSLAAVVGVATASFYLVERPFLRLRARFLSTKAVEPPEGAPLRPVPVPHTPGRQAQIPGSAVRQAT
jgi:peptidoglycan/LPS O-acetylase OafA/YrhL